MADQIVIPTKEEEKIPDEVKEYQELHNKSFKELMLEQQKETAKIDETPTEEIIAPPIETPKEENKPVETPEPKVDIAAIAKQAAEEALLKAREEDARKQQEAKAQEEQVKKQAALKDDLTPIWVKENREPATWVEAMEETKRIAKLEALAEIDTREAEKTRITEETKKAEEAKAISFKQQQDEFNKQLQSEMDTDLNDLYSTNKLPKIVDEKNPNDEGILARNALFMKGIEVNKERANKGLPPIRSIKLVYYEHYKAPSKQPAGHNAPVMGNAAPPAVSHNEDAYDWAKDHRKSPRQLLTELQRKAKAIVN